MNGRRDAFPTPHSPCRVNCLHRLRGSVRRQVVSMCGASWSPPPLPAATLPLNRVAAPSRYGRDVSKTQRLCAAGGRLPAGPLPPLPQ